MTVFFVVFFEDKNILETTQKNTTNLFTLNLYKITGTHFAVKHRSKKLSRTFQICNTGEENEDDLINKILYFLCQNGCYFKLNSLELDLTTQNCHMCTSKYL